MESKRFHRPASPRSTVSAPPLIIPTPPFDGVVHFGKNCRPPTPEARPGARARVGRGVDYGCGASAKFPDHTVEYLFES
jgi:hypothetical protein